MRKLTINLNAIVHNLDVMRARASQVMVCGVVKANAYGHGAVQVAKTLERAGVDYLGVADISEGLTLREAGISLPILAWLHDPAETFVSALTEQIELGIANTEQLQRILGAAAITGRVPKLHLKIDTGLGRNGSSAAEWPELLAAVKSAGAAVEVVGIFSHLSSTSREDDLAQLAKFDTAVAAVGLTRSYQTALFPLKCSSIWSRGKFFSTNAPSRYCLLIAIVQILDLNLCLQISNQEAAT